MDPEHDTPVHTMVLVDIVDVGDRTPAWKDAVSVTVSTPVRRGPVVRRRAKYAARTTKWQRSTARCIRQLRLRQWVYGSFALTLESRRALVDDVSSAMCIVPDGLLRRACDVSLPDTPEFTSEQLETIRPIALQVSAECLLWARQFSGQ